MKTLKVVSVEKMGRAPVYDISVKDAEHYILENGAITHNTGAYYSANDIWIIGRSQEKDGTDLMGYTFTINIEKSRTVREKSKIPLLVLFDGGITKWSGLLDLSLECGIIIKPKVGWYQVVDPETGEIGEKNYRAKDTNNDEFWAPILKSKKFQEFVKQSYLLVQEEIKDAEED